MVFQLRHSAPGAEAAERVHQEEETAHAKDLMWEDDCPSEGQKAGTTEDVSSKVEGQLKMS